MVGYYFFLFEFYFFVDCFMLYEGFIGCVCYYVFVKIWKLYEIEYIIMKLFIVIYYFDLNNDLCLLVYVIIIFLNCIYCFRVV